MRNNLVVYIIFFNHGCDWQIEITNVALVVYNFYFIVRIKSEIVTMQWKGDKRNGNGELTSATTTNSSSSNEIKSNDEQGNGYSCIPCCPTQQVGEYVSPNEWNKLLLDPDTLVVDTRNEYEIDVGTFRNATNPHTQSFVEFPDWMQRHIAAGNGNDVIDGIQGKSKIAMFCTGGIRCEKATNVCLQPVKKGISVYHLEGGILGYLEEFAGRQEESLFEGDCYVFDQRVAVT